MRRACLAALAGLLLLAGPAAADVVLDDVLPQGPQRVRPTHLTVDLGPFRACGYSRVEVEPGDTLYGIARTHLGDGKRWPEIAQLQDLEPAALGVGQTILLPPQEAPSGGADLPWYDFFLWAPSDPAPPIPFVPGEPYPTEGGGDGGYVVLAVEHAHLSEFLRAVRTQQDTASHVRAVVAKPWVAASEAIALPRARPASGTAAVFSTRATVTAIADGVVALDVIPPETISSPTLPAGELPPPDPYVADAPPTPDATEEGRPTEQTAPTPPLAASAPPAGEDARKRANPYLVAGLILAIALAAFLAIRHVSRTRNEEAPV